MWLLFAFCSAIFSGFYDVSKKASVRSNAVVPVLFLNCLFSTLIFLPCLIDGISGAGWFEGTAFEMDPFNPRYEGEVITNTVKIQLLIILKAFIVLTSWIFGYIGIKHLPITIVGPINATRPVLVLLGAMIIFGERLNLYQWIGVILAVISIFLLSRSTKKNEKVDFAHNRWIWCIAVATLVGASSGLYDRYLLRQFRPIYVQSWYNLYETVIMGAVLIAVWMKARKSGLPVSEGGNALGFTWRWSILLISVFLSISDFTNFTALSHPEAMVSVCSLIRRSSVIVSFICGALIFKEKNLRAKALDLLLILVGMFFIWLGSS